MNPYEALTEEDKQAIIEYCAVYGQAKPMDITKTLYQWNKNKRTLYKALGNQLRVSYPVEIEASVASINAAISNLYTPVPSVFSENELEWFLKENYNNDFINDFTTFLYNSYKNQILTLKTIDTITSMFSYRSVRTGYLDTPQTIVNSKTLELISIPAMTKIIKAIQKILKFLEYDRFDLFEAWKNKISDIRTTQKIKQNLVLSIHPIDYMTMSDNNCGWQSCMNWKNQGCYSLGTIEMMNSNMVVVAYLESITEFRTEATGDYNIPNKSWRCLLYVHKDILLHGKAYPYSNTELSTTAITYMRELVETNLKWKYQYINQRYGDLDYWNSNESLRDNRFYNKKTYRKYNGKPKQAIWVYMDSMYHDLIEDHWKKYMCCRNHVDKTVMLNASGPATCLCCGGHVQNDYYEGTSVKYCEDCTDKYYCKECDRVDPTIKHYSLPLTNGRYYKLCEHCITETKVYYSYRYNIFDIVEKNESADNLGSYSWVALIYNKNAATQELSKVIAQRRMWTKDLSKYDFSSYMNKNNSNLKIYKIPSYVLDSYKDYDIISIDKINPKDNYTYYRFKPGTKTSIAEEFVKNHDYDFVLLQEVENIDEIIGAFLIE